MRSGNKNSIIVSLLIMSLFFGCSDSTSPDEYSTLAKESLAKGNTNEAIINLKNLLRKDAKHSEGRFLLGKSYTQKGSWLSAEKELERALDYGYDSEKVLPELARAYHYTSNIKGLKILAEQSNTLSAKVQNEVKTFLAITYIKEENFQLGNIALLDVIESNFDSKYTQLSIAWSYGHERKLKKALSVVNQLIDDSPDFAEALDYQGFLYYAIQDMENSVISFEKFLAIHPLSIEARVMYGLALAGAGNFSEAEKQADVLLKSGSNNPYINQIKAQARFTAEDFVQAKQFSEVAIRANKKLVISRVIAGISAYQLKQPEVAYLHLNAINEQLTFKHPAKKLLTALKLQLGYEQDIFDDLSKAPIEQLDSSLLSFSAMELFKLGRASEADFLLAKAAKKSPKNADIIYQQGILKLLENDESATEYFKSALEKNPELDAALVMLVKNELTNKNFDAAHKLAESIAQENPELSQTFKGLIYTKQGDLLNAKQSYAEVLAINADNASVLYKLGEIAEQENDIVQAISYYKKALKADENSTPAVSALLKYSTNTVHSSDLKRFFELNVKKYNESAASTLALAAMYITTHDLTSAQKVIDRGLAVEPNNIKLLMFRGKIQANLKDFDGALSSFTQVIKQNPNLSHARLARVKILTLTGDYSIAIKELTDAIDLSPNSIALALDLIQLYIKTEELAAAKKVMANVKKNTNIEHIRIDWLEGQVAFLDKDYVKAEKLLSSVYRRIKSEKVLLELVKSLQELNRDEEALLLITSLDDVTETVLPLNILLKQAELSTTTNPTKSIEIYKHILKRSNNHYAMLNNLALVYMNTGEHEKALINAKAAFAQAPKVAAVQNTYGLVLLASHHNKDALTYLKQAIETDETNENFRVHYAQALLVNSDNMQAKKVISGLNKQALSKDSLDRLAKLSQSL